MEKHTGVFLFTATLVFLTMPWTARCCLGIARQCNSESDCCDKNCISGRCLRPCLADGNQCKSLGDCCSRFCDKSQCRCRKAGRNCSYDHQCCSKSCNKSVCGINLSPIYHAQLFVLHDV